MPIGGSPVVGPQVRWRAVVLAGVLGTGFLVISVILALWSLSWLIRGSLSNPDERTAEVEARERVAGGGPWVEGELPPRVLTDPENADLAHALQPRSPEEAGIEARPRETAPTRRFGLRRRRG